jgi:hypothetical protein
MEVMTNPGEIVHLPYVWDADDHSWEEQDYRPGYLPAYTR